MKRIALFAVLTLTLVGCAARQPVSILLPPPADTPLTFSDEKELGLRIGVPVSWLTQPTFTGNRFWKGPPCLKGRGEFLLITADDFNRPLDELVVAAARVHGVKTPTEPLPAQIAGTEGVYVSGEKGAVKRKVLTFAWREEERTFLLLVSWVNEDDGAAVAAMIESLKPL